MILMTKQHHNTTNLNEVGVNSMNTKKIITNCLFTYNEDLLKNYKDLYESDNQQESNNRKYHTIFDSYMRIGLQMEHLDMSSYKSGVITFISPHTFQIAFSINVHSANDVEEAISLAEKYRVDELTYIQKHDISHIHR